jgi:hypothetical protein
MTVAAVAPNTQENQYPGGSDQHLGPGAAGRWQPGPESCGTASHGVGTNGALLQVDGVTLQHKAPQTCWGMQY